jgi:hypothetical protein
MSQVSNSIVTVGPRRSMKSSLHRGRLASHRPRSRHEGLSSCARWLMLVMLVSSDIHPRATKS